ncbi:hypothetical protein Nepgr_017422 [Nepenthes gracilis]|uniref:Uncharacterized protein n=1 Tax=Nepenthes gracilis TaxID=150966 RepID=A0AAD3SS02_NEPGR|nr:hypothetical protein Nepgr_017422 [Nepenthes gracilis]
MQQKVMQIALRPKALRKFTLIKMHSKFSTPGNHPRIKHSEFHEKKPDKGHSGKLHSGQHLKGKNALRKFFRTHQEENRHHCAKDSNITLNRVDGSTPESIGRIARKYSLVDVVDGLSNKVPLVYQDVRSIPLSGCPIKSSEATSAEEVQPCDPGCGLVHALPNVDLCAGDPLAHAIPPSSEDNGILQHPDIHLPCYSKATSVPVEPSPGYKAAVQGLSPCNQSVVEHAVGWATARMPFAEAGTCDPQMMIRMLLLHYYCLMLMLI